MTHGKMVLCRVPDVDAHGKEKHTAKGNSLLCARREAHGK